MDGDVRSKNDEEAEGSVTDTIDNGVEEEADVTIGDDVVPVVGTTVDVDTKDGVGLTTDEVDSDLLFLEARGFFIFGSSRAVSFLGLYLRHHVRRMASSLRRLRPRGYIFFSRSRYYDSIFIRWRRGFLRSPVLIIITVIYMR